MKMMDLDNRRMYLNALDEHIRLASSDFTHGGYVALKVRFEELFPPYELDVKPYDHENKRLDHAVGYDREEMDNHPLIEEFNNWLISTIKTAYMEGKQLPALSVVWERLEALNIHPRLKIVASFIFYPLYQKAKADFRKRDMIAELKKAHEEWGYDGLLNHLSKLTKEHGEDKAETSGDEPLGGIRPEQGGPSDGGEHSGRDSAEDTPHGEQLPDN